MKNTLFDVVAVDLKTKKVRLLGTGKTYANADAIVNMAVMRRGVDEEFYSVTPAGMYLEGDSWKGNGGARDPNPPDPDARITTIGGMSYPIGARGLDR